MMKKLLLLSLFVPAIFVGAGYAVTDQLTTALSVSATTGHTHDVAGGAGIQYKF